MAPISAEQESKKEQEKIRRTVDTIFNIENAALGHSKEKSSELRAKYNDYVETITGTVKEQVSSLKNEREVFIHISSISYSNFDYAKGKLITTGLEEKPPSFNCYGSAVIFADVLSRLDFRFQVVKTPGHVLLLGNEYGFETTVEEGESMFYKRDLNKFHL